VDVIGLLSESPRPRKYLFDLKKRLSEGGSQVSAKIGQLKMQAPDGKRRETAVADAKNNFENNSIDSFKKSRVFQIMVRLCWK